MNKVLLTLALSTLTSGLGTLGMAQTNGTPGSDGAVQSSPKNNCLNPAHKRPCLSPAWHAKHFRAMAALQSRPLAFSPAATVPIVGVWDVNLTSKVDKSGDSDTEQLQLFTSDSLEIAMDISGTNGMGVWTSATKGTAVTYTLTETYWVYDDNGDPEGTGTLTEKLTIGKDGSTLSGTYTLTYQDFDGNSLDDYTDDNGTIDAQKVTA
jgi:hypothetical protein